MKNTGAQMVVLALLLSAGCSGVVSANQDTIEKVILERQLAKGHLVKKYGIVGHLDSTRSLTIFVKGTIDSIESFTDTIRFPLTMDGFIVR